MPNLFKGPRHAAAPETYEEVFEHLQADASAFAEEMAAANVRPDVGFEDVRPYVRHDPSESFPVCYFAIRGTTKYGGDALLAGRCHEWKEERESHSWARASREFGLGIGLSMRAQQAQSEKRQIAVLSVRNGGKLAIVTDHLHGYAKQHLRISTWDLSPREVLDDGLKNGLVSAQSVLRDWTKDLAAARDKYLRG